MQLSCCPPAGKQGKAPAQSCELPSLPTELCPVSAGWTNLIGHSDPVFFAGWMLDLCCGLVSILHADGTPCRDPRLRSSHAGISPGISPLLLSFTLLPWLTSSCRSKADSSAEPAGKKKTTVVFNNKRSEGCLLMIYNNAWGRH